MRNKSGFTILEVLIVVTIMAIMMAFGIPYILGWLPNYRLRNATRDVHSNLQLARITAVKEHVRCAVSFTKTGGTINGYIIYLDTNNNRIKDPDEEPIERNGTVKFPGHPEYAESPNYNDVFFDTTQESVGSPDGVNFQDNDNGEPTITFLTNGLVSGTFGTVFLTNNKGRQKSIVVNMAGRIRIPNS